MKMRRDLVRVAMYQCRLGSEERHPEFRYSALFSKGGHVILLADAAVSSREASTILEETLGRRQRHEVPLAN